DSARRNERGPAGNGFVATGISRMQGGGWVVVLERSALQCDGRRSRFSGRRGLVTLVQHT
ncbi:MAG: hypothetical protein RLN75_00560, partial [Longimicrobiales bacterium]